MEQINGVVFGNQQLAADPLPFARRFASYICFLFNGLRKKLIENRKLTEELLYNICFDFLNVVISWKRWRLQLSKTQLCTWRLGLERP